MPPLQKTFPLSALVRSGGDALITVVPAVCPQTNHRWGFRVIATADRKGAIKAAVEYGQDKDYPARKKCRRGIEDFAVEDLDRLCNQIVNEETGQAGSSLWRPPTFRSVTYIATVSTGTRFNVSLQARKMQIDSGVFSNEPCAAEVMRGRRESTLVETTARGLCIDDAYEVFERLWRTGHIRE